MKKQYLSVSDLGSWGVDAPKKENSKERKIPI
jgi:hypothetical protein